MQSLDTIFSNNTFNFNNIIKDISSDLSQTTLPSSSTTPMNNPFNMKQNAKRPELEDNTSAMFASAYPNTMEIHLNHPEDFLITHEDENKEINLIGGINQSPNSPALSRSSKKITKFLPDTIILREEKSKGKKRPWQPSEDAKVLELLGNYGQSWALIAAALGNRTGKQVRDRYLNYLRPDIKDEDFNVQEDRLLLALYYQLGAKWSKIASHMPGRTECQVKNRFYAHIKKRLMFPEFNAKTMAKANINETVWIEDNNSEKRESELKSEIEKKEEFYVSRELLQSSPEEHAYPVIPTLFETVSHQNQNGNVVSIEKTIQMQGNIYQNPTVQTQPFVNNQAINPIEGLNSLIEPLNQLNRSQMNISLDRNGNEIEQNEQTHAHALLSLESEFVNRDKFKRYEELLRRKNALEFFYTKTLQEMNSLGIVGFGVPGMM